MEEIGEGWNMMKEIVKKKNQYAGHIIRGSCTEKIFEHPIRKILRCHFKKTMKYGLNDVKS